MARIGVARLKGLREISLLVAAALSAVVVAAPAHARDVRRSNATAPRITRASWYGKTFQGKLTAGGSMFNPHRLTAAHRTIHLGSTVKVTELRTGRSVVVRITDRGPFLPGRDIDLSYAAARQLGIVRRGVARVRLELLDREPPAPAEPLITACSWPMSAWLPQAIAE